MKYLVTYTSDWDYNEKRMVILDSLKDVKSQFTGQTALNHYSNIRVYEIGQEINLKAIL
jgi:hypothetical protein